MASVFQSGKFWRAQVRRRGYPSLSATFDTKREALQWAAQIEARLETQTPGQVYKKVEARELTLKAALERYKREILPSKAPHTARRERSLIEWWSCSLWQAVPLPNLDGPQVAQAIRAMEKENRSANTIRLMLAILSHLYTIARKEWGYVDLINPVELVRKPRLPEGRDRRFVGNEEERLLEACARKNPELTDFVIVALETAMRQGEVFTLTWDRISFIDHTIKLPPELTKTRKGRTVPLSERAEDALKRQRARPRKPGNRVWTYATQDGVRASFFKAVKVAGLEDFHFHDLRHEATSRFFERGLNAAVVQGITGHKTAQMLARYTHLSGKSLVEAVRGTDPANGVSPTRVPSTPPSTIHPQRFCTSCGAALAPEHRFCGGCGKPTSGHGQQD
ncbi:tyrosine-type recombinase/integrase [Acidithiobacillus caldus]|uniref:tyrosine-type recombinase/integrase n=2 Tax=Acidithiobacillus caldus TaxID=33059 RepID=UPI001C0739FD|nr:tyrosine-type recombinase/integrase [Acidithiobacillus caldus]MBU2791533.1 tyrosine-type recombinase/integrase [Acidithiobacillus caldus]